MGHPHAHVVVEHAERDTPSEAIDRIVYALRFHARRLMRIAD